MPSSLKSRPQAKGGQTMNDPNADNPASAGPYSFSGWIRRGRGPWRLLCRGASEQAVLRQLLVRRYRDCEKRLLRGDGNPNREQL
jgi:hypothetical protein